MKPAHRRRLAAAGNQGETHNECRDAEAQRPEIWRKQKEILLSLFSSATLRLCVPFLITHAHPAFTVRKLIIAEGS
jgi:hypothetical protein